MFEHRRTIQKHITELYPDMISNEDIVSLFTYSEEKFGVIDYSQTHLLFDILEILKISDNKAYEFIEYLTQRAVSNGTDTNLFIIKDRLVQFLYT
jgi:hypothetical protein